jgi:iron complex transport system substrate-binding protein
MQAEGLNERPSVVCLEWLDPLMVAGTWVPELVRLAGGHDCLGADGAHATTVAWEAVVEADPEVLVLMPCGFDIARCRAELPALTGRPGWADLRAVRARRVAVTDGNQFFNRPGPRIVESLEILLEILHPARFAFGHEGEGWQPLDGG